MGEYTGRRRGRPASEPEPEPEPRYEPEPQYYYEQDYQPGYEQPSYEQSSYEQPSYEQPSYEQPSYEQPGYEQPSYEQPGYEQPSYDYDYQQRPHSRRGLPSPEEMYASEYGYSEQYTEEYAEQYTEEYVEDYAQPRFEPRRRSAAGPAEEYASDYAPEYDYAPDYDYAPPAPARTREALPLLSHLPFLGASTAALVVASFVSAKAVAAVVLPLQLLVAWAVLDLAGHASRRTAAFVALPTLAATVGTFKFQADESATAIAGGLGAGFFLLAVDAVFRAGRRGVQPGTVQAVAAAASALLFAGLTGLFLPAARLHASSVAIGAAVGALVGLVAARGPELGSSRIVVVALPATAAALASYAAAILMA